MRWVGISLLADERTVAGGTATTTWLYFDDHRWKSVKEHPSASFCRQECGPGVTWQTRAEFEVAPFTWLQRVDRSPHRSKPPSDPLEYLRRELVRRRYAVRRTFFQVSPEGRLIHRPREEAPLDAEFERDG